MILFGLEKKQRYHSITVLNIEVNGVPDTICCFCGVGYLGCTYASSMYEINNLGDCCEKQCYAVDEFGDECSFEASSGSRGTYSLTQLVLPVGMILLSGFV